MRVKDVITGIRGKVNDPSGVHWTDVQIMYWISAHNRFLFRRRAQAEDLYGQVKHNILASETARVRQVKDDVFRYYLPTWWHKIYEVRDLSDASSVGTTGDRGKRIKRRPWPRDPLQGWHLSGDRTIDLVSYNEAIDLEITIAKVPPLLHYGVVDATAQGSNELRLASAPMSTDTTPGPFPLSREKDAFVGMEFEITSGSTQVTDRRGVVVECIAQEWVYSGDVNAWVARCTIFPEFPTPVRSGDVYEMHIPVDETNQEYISSLVARSLFVENRNEAGIRSLESMLKEGEETFVSGLRPRQEQDRDVLIHPDFLGIDPEALDNDWTGEVR